MWPSTLTSKTTATLDVRFRASIIKYLYSEVRRTSNTNGIVNSRRKLKPFENFSVWMVKKKKQPSVLYEILYRFVFLTPFYVKSIKNSRWCYLSQSPTLLNSYKLLYIFVYLQRECDTILLKLESTNFLYLKFYPRDWFRKKLFEKGKTSIVYRFVSILLRLK